VVCVCMCVLVFILIIVGLPGFDRVFVVSLGCVCGWDSHRNTPCGSVFSNMVKSTQLEELAEADEHEVVQHVQEFFGDYYAITSRLFSLNLPHVVALRSPDWPVQQDRISEGLISCILSLKKQPFIRYSGKSDMCKKVRFPPFLSFGGRDPR
jgi:hypothetical protein